MDRDTLQHVFEPFFTTKSVEEGTGLGLATVHGIVKQNDGFVQVTSEVGRGTSFRLHLPRTSEAPTAPAPRHSKSLDALRGEETILLVEDDSAIRVTTRLILERLGYRLLIAETPREALETACRESEPIDLLISDVIMPGMNGAAMAEELGRIHPAMKRLFISGYTADVCTRRGILEAGGEFLGKPFTREELARKVRDVLEGVEPPSVIISPDQNTGKRLDTTPLV
jgi:CheY-like chemotaxis protein